MAPVSRTSSPHNIINCKECSRARLTQIKGQMRDTGTMKNNDMNSNDEVIDIHHACKFSSVEFIFFIDKLSLNVSAALIVVCILIADLISSNVKCHQPLSVII